MQQVREAVSRRTRCRSDSRNRACTFSAPASCGTTCARGGAIRRSVIRQGNTYRRWRRKGRLEGEPVTVGRLRYILLVRAARACMHRCRCQVYRMGDSRGFLFIAIAAIRVLRIKSIHYHLTSQRLRITKGILNRKIVEIELFRVRDLTIQQGFIQRLLTLGTVKAISTDEDATEILLSGIADAMKVKEDLRKYVMESRKATGTRDLDMSVVR